MARRDHDVRRLEIAVDNLHAVRRVERIEIWPAQASAVAGPPGKAPGAIAMRAAHSTRARSFSPGVAGVQSAERS
jgi:hypothetical protein